MMDIDQVSIIYSTAICFPSDSVVKNPSANVGDTGPTPGQEDPLEKEMATHSNILAWEIPWTKEEPCSYSPWGLQKSQTHHSN